MICGEKSSLFKCSKVHSTTGSLETLTLFISMHQREFYITTVYWRPTCPTRDAIHTLSSILRQTPSCATHVILGDFNEDLILRSNTPVKDFFTTHGFKQVVTGPTTNYGSLLDHIYMKDKETQTTTCHTRDMYFTDQDLTILEIQNQSFPL